MGLGDVIKNLMGKEDKKEFKSPDVKFLDDDDPTGVTHTMPITVETPQQQYIIKCNEEYLVFNSLDEMPPELREELSHLDESSDFTNTYSVIINGEKQTYASLDEVPEEIRKELGDKL